MKNGYVLAIDRGSTNVKAVLVDTGGREILVASQPSEKPVSRYPRWFEQDMNQMWQDTVLAVRKAVSSLSDSDEIIGVSVTGQGSGVFLADKEGSPVRPGIISLDSRAAELSDEIIKTEVNRYFKKHTGRELLPSRASVLCLWIKQNEPENYKKIHKVLFSKDWIRFKLIGRYVTDPTDASPGGLFYDIEKASLAPEMADMLDMPEIKDAIPELLPSHAQAGTVTAQAAKETGLKQGTPVITGAHDMMCYPFGNGTLSFEDMSSVMGTWGLNFMPSRTWVSTCFSFPHLAPGYFLKGACDGNSGSCLDRMIDLLADPYRPLAAKAGKSLYDYLDGVIAGRPDSRLIFHPFMVGALFDSNATSGLYNIRDWHTRDDLMKAVYEGIVFCHYDNILTVEGHEAIKNLWLTGGGSMSPVIGQLFADIMGYNVNTTTAREGTARGCALNAMVGLGVYQTHEEACIPAEIKRQYRPNPEKHAFYQKKYAQWAEIYKLMTPVWKQIKELESEEDF
jgi:L-xylulokinase